MNKKQEYTQKFIKKISECKTSILTEYFNLFIKYYQEYGPKMALFMQVGDFYEAYTYVENHGTDQEIHYGNGHELASVLNFKLARKNPNKPYSINNCQMLGYPIRSFEKNIECLINAGYTTVVYKQQPTGIKANEYERVLSRIISASTYLPDNSSVTTAGNDIDSNNLLQVVLTDSSNYYYLSTCVIDLCSGKVWLNTQTIAKNKIGKEIFDTPPVDLKQGIKCVHDIVYRVYKSYSPVEVCVNTKNQELLDQLKINKTLEFPSRVNVFEYPSIDHKKQKIQFQEEILRRSYSSSKSIVSPISYLGLDRDQESCLALVLAIDFAYRHDTSIVKRLDKPIIGNTNTNLVIEGNGIKQLDILDSSLCPQSLFKTINYCRTCMGRRLLKDRLVSPETKPTVINKRYDQVESFKKLDADAKASIRKILTDITDISRIHRRMIAGFIKYYEFSRLDRAYKNTHKLLTLVIHSKQEPLVNIIRSKNRSAVQVLAEFVKIIKYYRKRIDIAAIDTGDIHKLIKPGISAELDQARKDHGQAEQELEEIRETLSDLVKKHCGNWSDRYKNAAVMTKTFKENKKETIRLDMTKKRYQELCKTCKDNPLVSSLDAKYVGDRARINSPIINSLSLRIIKARETIEPIIEKEFRLIMGVLVQKYNCLNHICNTIAVLDIVQSTEYLSAKYNYCKPQIDQIDSNKSYVDIKQLRHPIIERIIDNIYVPNDIKLGTNESKIDGLIVYGLNSVGKSSLLKSVCLNTILAQAGIYTAATEFKYWPYQNIFTRLPGTDNQYLGMSNFICEVMDLKSIINGSNKNTLCILDEISVSTEQISGITISASTINLLANKQTSFLFATHYHSLIDLDQIKELKNVGIAHLDAKMGTGMGEIHFTRKLIEGPPKDKQYGLEVCKNIIKNTEFLRLAEEIRLSLNNRTGLVETNNSHFNSNLVVDHCELCDKTDTLEVHHINMQCKANSKGFIDHFHKNNLGNLVVLCWDCHHKKVHSNPAKVIIKGWIDTSGGRVLDHVLNE